MQILRRWNVAIAYIPKLQGVYDGSIRQTIRRGNKSTQGDLISFHGWAGRPYHSEWSCRTPYFRLTKVTDIRVSFDGIEWLTPRGGEPEGGLVPWSDPRMDQIAQMDGIVPPTGQALSRVLTRFNKILPEGYTAQILQWTPTRPNPFRRSIV